MWSQIRGWSALALGLAALFVGVSSITTSSIFAVSGWQHERPASVTDAHQALEEQYASEITDGLEIRWDSNDVCSDDPAVIAGCVKDGQPLVIHLAERHATAPTEHLRYLVVHEATHLSVHAHGVTIPDVSVRSSGTFRKKRALQTVRQSR